MQYIPFLCIGIGNEMAFQDSQEVQPRQTALMCQGAMEQMETRQVDET